MGKEARTARDRPPAAIEQLPSSISASLRASLHLFDLSSIISQLALNSLDSSSKTIHIALDLTNWTVSCTDDGSGFHSSILEALADKNRHQDPTTSLLTLSNDSNTCHSHSSTSNGPVKYGHKGETLLSLAQLGLLQIQSIPFNRVPVTSSPSKSYSIHSVNLRDNSQEWTLLRKSHKVLYYGPSKSDASHQPTFEQSRNSANLNGSSTLVKKTTVIARDLFHSLPVRRSALLNPSSCRIEIEKARKSLAVIALREPSVRFFFSVKEALDRDKKVKTVLSSGKVSLQLLLSIPSFCSTSLGSISPSSDLAFLSSADSFPRLKILRSLWRFHRSKLDS